MIDINGREVTPRLGQKLYLIGRGTESHWVLATDTQLANHKRHGFVVIA